jgi:hypothetical protein
MKDARSTLLKLGAVLITLGATVGSALYVTAHLKNPGAPLRPTVLSASVGATVDVPGGGSLTLTPAVRPSDVQPVTSTYAS